MTRIAVASGLNHSEALAINSHDQVVGWMRQGSEQHAFLHRDGVFYRLDDLVQGAPGWRFEIALSINDAGQIVGLGMLDGIHQAFLLTPK